jgi:hypothetical protein
MLYVAKKKKKLKYFPKINLNLPYHVHIGHSSLIRQCELPFAFHGFSYS